MPTPGYRRKELTETGHAGNNIVAIFVTASNQKEAEKIADILLNQKLVACANIIPGISSFFWWEGKKESSTETLLILKSTLTHLEEIINAVKRIHSYTVPEVIAIPVIGGNEHYLKWVREIVLHD
ncbi:MAG: divalent-cation tolerance protein CutA [Caldiserica bacterium]|nr:divalent-cation tolerance protein CutA [Caldisericota bacterium]